MRSLVFEGNTWAAYEQLRVKDKKLHKALCKLLKEMLRFDPGSGLGRPEQLKHNLSGLWSLFGLKQENSLKAAGIRRRDLVCSLLK